MNSQNSNIEALLSDSGSDGGIDFRALVDMLWGSRWLILLAAAFGASLLATLNWLSQPQYKAETTIQMEAVRSLAGLGVTTPVANEMFDEFNIGAETQVLSSRRIMAKVADKLGFQIVVKPKYFPVIGKSVARSARPGEPREAPLGLDAYAWGGEVIDVAQLTLPPELEGRSFTLRATQALGQEKGEAAFELISNRNPATRILSGTVGKKIEAELDEGTISILVRELKARPGTEFKVIKRSRPDAANSLKGRLQTKPIGFNTGILSISMRSGDPEQAADMANAVAKTFQEYNFQRQSLQTKKSIDFMKKELTALEQKIAGAEKELNEFKLAEGSVDLNRETNTLLERSTELESDLARLSREREELLKLYLPSHPSVATLSEQITALERTKRQLQRLIVKLPEKQQRLLRLQRDVSVTTSLYSTMQNQIQEYELVRAGLVGNIHILDEALPAKSPTTPGMFIYGVFGFLLGSFIALGSLLITFLLRTGVDSPEAVEKALGLPTYASIPYSSQQAKELKRGAPNNQTLLADSHPQDVSIEAIRSLRTALQFTQFDSGQKSIVISGPLASVGKSFVSLNLGAVLAQAGKRVVLVDADLRNGHIHNDIGAQAAPGLSNLLTSGADSITEQDTLRATVQENLFVITRGDIPPNPSELLLRDSLKHLLDKLEDEFDYVILDTPPALLVTDAAIIARHGATSILVIQAGKHTMESIEESVKRLNSAGAKVSGVVFNQVGRRNHSYGKGYGYGYGYGNTYSYEYKSETTGKATGLYNRLKSSLGR